MSTAAVTNPQSPQGLAVTNKSQEFPLVPSLILGVAATAPLGATLGALGAWIFTPINPATGALFGALNASSTAIINIVTERLGWNPENLVLKISKFALTTLVSIGIASAVTTALGFSLSFGAGAGLAASALITGTAITGVFATSLVVYIVSSRMNEGRRSIMVPEIRTTS